MTKIDGVANKDGDRSSIQVMITGLEGKQPAFYCSRIQLHASKNQKCRSCL